MHVNANDRYQSRPTKDTFNDSVNRIMRTGSNRHVFDEFVVARMFYTQPLVFVRLQEKIDCSMSEQTQPLPKL